MSKPIAFTPLALRLSTNLAIVVRGQGQRPISLMLSSSMTAMTVSPPVAIAPRDTISKSKVLSTIKRRKRKSRKKSSSDNTITKRVILKGDICKIFMILCFMLDLSFISDKHSMVFLRIIIAHYFLKCAKLYFCSISQLRNHIRPLMKVKTSVLSFCAGIFIEVSTLTGASAFLATDDSIIPLRFQRITRRQGGGLGRSA